MITMPRSYTLDEAIEIDDQLEGVALQMLEASNTIHARTRHSDYQIFLLDPESGQAMVQGGRHFVEPVEAIVSGSTFGGCMIKLGWLGIGLCMEIHANGRQIVTTPVQSLRVSHLSTDPENANDDQPVALSLPHASSREPSVHYRGLFRPLSEP